MRYKSGEQQAGLFACHERTEALSRRTTPLNRLNERIDWEHFRLDLEGHLDYRSGAQGGRSPWCPVLMFKILGCTSTTI